MAVFWIYFWFLNLLRIDDFTLDPWRYLSYSVISLIGLMIYLVRSDETQFNLVAQDVLRGVRLALRQMLHVAAALMFTLLLAKDQGISRLFLFTFLPVLGVAFAVANTLLPRILCKSFFAGRHAYQGLLVGPGRRISKIRNWMNYVSRFGLEFIGILSDEAEDRRDAGELPMLGRLEDLKSVLDGNKVSLIVLLEVPADDKELEALLLETERRGIRLSAVNTLAERFRHSVSYFQHDGIDFMSIRQEPLEDPMARAIKRFADIAISLPIVVLVLPLLTLMVAIMQRLQSPGPILFRQIRSGFGNAPFEILKFRSMDVRNDDPARQATKSDSRTFEFGKFLRKSSLDEFPQFLNVLRGEMSIVGPRPHMLEHDALFARALNSYHIRSLVKPGITGLAQVRGFRGEARTEEDICRRVECDIEYIENWSPLMDLFIFLKTARHVLFPPKSAY